MLQRKLCWQSEDEIRGKSAKQHSRVVLRGKKLGEIKPLKAIS